MRHYTVAAALLLAAPALADTDLPYGGKGPGEIYGFGVSKCKSPECWRKHPSGEWLHPLTVPWRSAEMRRPASPAPIGPSPGPGAAGGWLFERLERVELEIRMLKQRLSDK